MKNNLIKKKLSTEKKAFDTIKNENLFKNVTIMNGLSENPITTMKLYYY